MLRNSRKGECLVSLEFFHKMLKDPNKHSLGKKVVVEIVNNKQQCTVVEHQRANNRQQARITTREIKPSEVQQFLIFKDDSSKPQVQMHADCHNIMPMLKYLTSEELNHLQPGVPHHKNFGFSSTLENPNPLSSSQRSLEDHTISSSTLHMKNWPTLKMNRGVVSSFVYTITPPSAVEDQKPINPQSLKNFQQHAINLEQYQNKQFYNKLRQVQGTVLQNIPLESAAQYQYIKNINQDVQQQHLISLRQVLSATETTRLENAVPFWLPPFTPANTTNVSFPPPPSPNFIKPMLLAHVLLPVE
ncbi:unnamed protein product [Timema podura]|uniref:Uncharacterized protein n=1 Tax=Timema podura TaxID=61482 RepID=A0ABN7P5X7_TIMPD|nr:unnamed protein product [Timema podura]